MSKLGSAPPPPPYKVPLSERLFGIGKLRPPVTSGVDGAGAALPASIRLGDFTLVMDARGDWQMSSALVSMYQQQISALEAKVAQLEDERLNRNVFELEKQNIALERERLAIVDENNQLKFKNKVLMAMCTISEVSGRGGGSTATRGNHAVDAALRRRRPPRCTFVRPLVSCALSIAQLRQCFAPRLLCVCVCVLGQGDYKSLCKEAGLEPRSQKKPTPAPAPLSSPQFALQQQQQQPQPQPTPSSSSAQQQQQQYQQQQQQLYASASPMSGGAPPASAYPNSSRGPGGLTVTPSGGGGGGGGGEQMQAASGYQAQQQAFDRQGSGSTRNLQY